MMNINRLLIFITIVFYWIAGNTQNQKFLLGRYENLPYDAAALTGEYMSFLYYLEEGSLSEYMDYVDNFHIPQDSLNSWGCFYKYERKSGYFNESDYTVLQYSKEKNIAHDSLIHERIYLEVLEQNKIKIAFSMRIVQYEKR